MKEEEEEKRKLIKETFCRDGGMIGNENYSALSTLIMAGAPVASTRTRRRNNIDC